MSVIFARSTFSESVTVSDDQRWFEVASQARREKCIEAVDASKEELSSQIARDVSIARHMLSHHELTDCKQDRSSER